MGSCIYSSNMGTLDKQNALASLAKWSLIQDNSGQYRVYRDEKNNVYHSVTHILKETAPKTHKVCPRKMAGKTRLPYGT